MTLPSSWSSSPFMVTVKSMMDVRAEISGVYDGFGSFVVMYNVKPFMMSHSLSPTLTFNADPTLMKFFSRTLSRAGSRSSATSSSSSGRPSDMESSRWVRKYLWFRDVTCNISTDILSENNQLRNTFEFYLEVIPENIKLWLKCQMTSKECNLFWLIWC